MPQANGEMTSWVEALGDKATLAEGWKALQAAGNAAIPAVRDGLSHPNPRVRQFCAAFIDAHWDESALQRLISPCTTPS